MTTQTQIAFRQIEGIPQYIYDTTVLPKTLEEYEVQKGLILVELKSVKEELKWNPSDSRLKNVFRGINSRKILLTCWYKDYIKYNPLSLEEKVLFKPELLIKELEQVLEENRALRKNNGEIRGIVNELIQKVDSLTGKLEAEKIKIQEILLVKKNIKTITRIVGGMISTIVQLFFDKEQVGRTGKGRDLMTQMQFLKEAVGDKPNPEHEARLRAFLSEENESN